MALRQYCQCPYSTISSCHAGSVISRVSSVARHPHHFLPQAGYHVHWHQTFKDEGCGCFAADRHVPSWHVPACAAASSQTPARCAGASGCLHAGGCAHGVGHRRDHHCGVLTGWDLTLIGLHSMLQHVERNEHGANSVIALAHESCPDTIS